MFCPITRWTGEFIDQIPFGGNIRILRKTYR